MLGSAKYRRCCLVSGTPNRGSADISTVRTRSGLGLTVALLSCVPIKGRIVGQAQFKDLPLRMQTVDGIRQRRRRQFDFTVRERGGRHGGTTMRPNYLMKVAERGPTSETISP